MLPTRDLVSQVRETFEAVTKGTGLKVRTIATRVDVVGIKVYINISFFHSYFLTFFICQIATATGHHSFAQEQAQIVDNLDDRYG